ncbi:MAG: asparagine synthase [Lentisphaeraceae bacterium]|nr:asparagine synthase [Lentisphaeraceae bacterium]
MKLRMRSDVPVGSCLSGGLDSTAIVSLMASENPQSKFKTFTAVYGDPQYDEDAYVRETAAMHPELDPRFIKLNSDDLWDKLQDLIRIQDEPFQSSSIFAQYAVMKTAKDAGYKVLMDGQGADECLAGYDIYLSSWATGAGGVNFLRRAKKIRQLRRIKPLNLIVQAVHSRLYKSKYMDKVYHLTAQVSSQVLNRDFKKRQSYRPYWKHFSRDFLKDHLYQMLFFSNLPPLLRYEDRNSMACSIETRLPYLDPLFVEECFTYSSDLYIQNAITKFPLREAVKEVIPQSVVRRKDKIGFATPEQKWFSSLKAEVKAVFSSESFKNRGYFDVQRVNNLFDAYCEGKSMRKFPLWRILNLELWLREFIDEK